MSTAGRPPEDRTSGLTGGPSAEDGTEHGSSPRERPPRLQSLAGLAVRGSDGRVVGRVRDIYQQDASGALAAITVMPRQLSARTVLIPAAAIESLPPAGEAQDESRPDAEARSDAEARPDAEARSDVGTRPDAAVRSEGASPEKDPAVRLRVDAAAARAGRRPPEIAHVTPQDLREAAEALGLDPDVPARTGDGPRSDRGTGADRGTGSDGGARSGSARPDGGTGAGGAADPAGAEGATGPADETR